MIPLPAFVFGLIGLVPFLAGASLATWPLRGEFLEGLARDNWLLLHYGTVILCFMSGVLWGFATRAETEGTEAALTYTLASLPAVFSAVALAPFHTNQVAMLIAGFVGLLLLDFWFWIEGIAPVWWMRFRAFLTVVVVASLASAL